MLWYEYSSLSLNPLYCLYVVSNTMYKDHGVFLFFFFFFFFYLVSSQQATRVIAPDALRTVLVITTTLTLPACHMYKRTATERMVRISPVQWFFNFPGVGQPLSCDTGIVYCPWIHMYCDIFSSLTPRRWTKLSKTPKVYRPIRLTQCCTQFKSAGDKILCVFYLHYNVAFSFKWYGNSWNKTFYSQRVWIGYKIELAE